MAVQTNANNVNKSVNAGKFLRNVRSELKKVIWPNKKDLISYTTVVLTTCVLASVGIWVLDTVFGKALQLIIK